MKPKRQPKAPTGCQNAITCEVLGERFKIGECMVENPTEQDLWCEWCKAQAQKKVTP